MSRKAWFGYDVSNKESLSEDGGGYLMRRKSKGSYEVWVRVADHFVHGSFWLEGWIKDFDDDNEWSSLAECVGMSGEEYRKAIVDNKVEENAAVIFFGDLLGYTDLDSLLGYTSWGPYYYSESEVKVRLNKALAA